MFLSCFLLGFLVCLFIFGGIVLAVCLFCIALIICFGSSSFWYWLLVIQHVKLWCCCSWYFHSVFGVFLILVFFVVFFCCVLFCLFIVWMHCFGITSLWYCLLVIQHVKHWCHCLWGFHLVFGVFQSSFVGFFVGCCSVCSFFGCIVLVVHPFVLLIGWSAWEPLMSLFWVVLFGVWRVFDLVLLHIFSLVIVLFVCFLDALFL